MEIISVLPWIALGAVLLAGSAGAFVWLLGRPKPLVGAVVIYSLFSQTIATVGGASVLGYGDEVGTVLVLVLCCIWRLREHGTLRAFAALWFFLGFVLIGAISSVVQQVPPVTALTGAFLFLKGPLLAFAVAQLDWRSRDLAVIARWGAGVVALILFVSLLNAASPAAWNDVVGRTDRVSERGGFTSLTGPFDHPVGLGTTMAMAFLALLLYRAMVRRSTATLLLLVGTGLACLASFRRKSIFAVLATALFTRSVLPGPKSLYVVGLVLLTPVGLVLGWGVITQVIDATIVEYTTNMDEIARIRLTVDGVDLAIAAFPLGVGFGRFGSFAAADDYSPIYEDLGYRRIWGLGQGDMGGFLSDTFWPAPFAETGLLGVLCYIAALLLLVRPGWLLMRRAGSPLVRWIGAVTVAWFVQLGIESVVAPVFVSPPMYALPFAAAGLCLALTARGSAREAAGWAHRSQRAEQSESTAAAGAPWAQSPEEERSRQR